MLLILIYLIPLATALYVLLLRESGDRWTVVTFVGFVTLFVYLAVFGVVVWGAK